MLPSRSHAKVHGPGDTQTPNSRAGDSSASSAAARPRQGRPLRQGHRRPTEPRDHARIERLPGHCPPRGHCPTGEQWRRPTTPGTTRSLPLRRTPLNSAKPRTPPHPRTGQIHYAETLEQTAQDAAKSIQALSDFITATVHPTTALTEVQPPEIEAPLPRVVQRPSLIRHRPRPSHTSVAPRNELRRETARLRGRTRPA